MKESISKMVEIGISHFYDFRENGLNGIKLTGGEPLIHPDINEILNYLSNEDLRLTIETNGVTCTPEIVEKIVKCKNPFVSVSLDGADEKTHEREGTSI